jgi:hypothetical protein
MKTDKPDFEKVLSDFLCKSMGYMKTLLIKYLPDRYGIG